MPDEPILDAPGIVEVLHRHGVRYVLIGGLGAAFHGSPLRTDDADICPARDRENLERLAAALEEMDARLRSPSDPGGVPFVRDAEALDRAEIWTLITRFGPFDVSYTPAGTGGFEDLRRQAVIVEAEGVRIPVASLLDIIRSKEAAGRQKDLQALPTLRELQERLEEGPPPQ